MTVDSVRTRLLAYLPDPYEKGEGSANYGLMTSFATEFDMSYSEIDDLHTQVGVNTATDGYLDDIGYLFRIQRQTNETDAELRSRIKAYFQSYSGGGTAPSIQSAVALATGQPLNTVTITDIPDLKFLVHYAIPVLSPIIGTVKSIVNSAKAAGTYAYFSVTVDIDANTVKVVEVLNFTTGAYIIVSAYDVGGDYFV